MLSWIIHKDSHGLYAGACDRILNLHVIHNAIDIDLYTVQLHPPPVVPCRTDCAMTAKLYVPPLIHVQLRHCFGLDTLPLGFGYLFLLFSLPRPDNRPQTKELGLGLSLMQEQAQGIHWARRGHG